MKNLLGAKSFLLLTLSLPLLGFADPPDFTKVEGAGSGGGGLAKPVEAGYKLVDFALHEGRIKISPKEILRCEEDLKSDSDFIVTKKTNTERPLVFGCADPLLKKLGRALPNFETTLRTYLEKKKWWLDPKPLSKEGCESEYWLASQNGWVLAACQKNLDVIISAEVYFGFINDHHRTGLWTHELLQAHRLFANKIYKRGLTDPRKQGTIECTYENLMEANVFWHTNDFSDPKEVQDEFRVRGFFRWATSIQIDNMNRFIEAVKERVRDSKTITCDKLSAIYDEEKDIRLKPTPFPGYANFGDYISNFCFRADYPKPTVKELRNFGTSYKLPTLNMDWTMYEREYSGFVNE